MAMIECKECQKRISDKAATCPSCGSPNPKQAQTIERTSKKLKAQELASIILTIIGMVGCTIQTQNGNDPTTVLLFMIGIIWFLVARLLIWWRHE